MPKENRQGSRAQTRLSSSLHGKPYGAHPGNGMHVHASVLDANGAALFSSQDDAAPNPSLRYAMGGLLNSMADFQLAFAPHSNSYRRLQRGSYAPVTPCWGLTRATPQFESRRQEVPALGLSTGWLVLTPIRIWFWPPYWQGHRRVEARERPWSTGCNAGRRRRPAWHRVRLG